MQAAPSFAILFLCLGLALQDAWSFMLPSSHGRLISPLRASVGEKSSSSAQEMIKERLSREWELDCYSRPVLGEDGKKLWELLICDALGQQRIVERLPSNMVNSRELRKLVEKAIDEAETKPRVIRFFRNAMYNMINLALKDLKVRIVPSRSTNALYAWLDERDQEVYSKMPTYDPTMKESNDIFSLRESEQMPAGLMGEKYAFMCLPASHFLDGEINYENMGIGKLAPMPKNIARDTMVQGIVMYSPRARSIATWLQSMELCFLRANFSKRQLVLETGIDTQYLFATLNDVRRVEAQLFEKGKEALGGLHFVALQESEESEDVQGFFLLRERKQR